MIISYGITVCDEFEEIQRLIPFLLSHKNTNDEVVVLFDKKNGTNDVQNYLKEITDIKLIVNEFKNDFGTWKNILNESCIGDYIFQLDADEMLNETLLNNIHDIISLNQSIDLFYFPRLNIVDGITEEHIKKWNWNISVADELVHEKEVINIDEYKLLKKYNLIISENLSTHKVIYYLPIINKPDYQGRLYKKGLKWEGNVHERIVGALYYSLLPDDDLNYYIEHKKEIKRQEKQNKLYERITWKK